MAHTNERSVYFALTKGRPFEVASTLRRRVSAYTRHGCTGGFKIGITNNPYARFSNGYARDYDEMIVIYQSSSLDSVSRVECDLIEHNAEICRNRIAGGGGDYGNPPYYLYVVLRHRER